jgi:predicted nucleic acid-binding protein
MKAYLDNNIVSAIAKDDTPAETDALSRLLTAYEAGKVDLVTSEVTHTEIKKYDVSMRPRVEWIFRLLHKVPMVQWDKLLGMHSHGDQHTWITSPIVQTDPLYGKLHDLGVETTDAQHLFVAAKNACDVFLTCDGGVLARRDAIKKLCGVTVQKPSEFVAAQGW